MMACTCPAAQLPSPASSPTEHDASWLWRGSRKSRMKSMLQDRRQSRTREHLWIEEVQDNASQHEDDLRWFASTEEPEGNKSRSAGVVGWKQMLSLDDILLALEEGSQPAPSVEELITILQKCRKERNQTCAFRLHAYMRQCGLEIHKVLGNHLIPLLVDVGSIDKAHQVFSKLQFRSHVSWNSLIAGYVRFEKPEQALILYCEMRNNEFICPNGFTYVPALKACIDLNDFKTGSEIHRIVDENGLLEKDVFVGNTLIDMYAKWGFLEKAQEVFDKLVTRDIVSWNTLLAGYAQHEHHNKAFSCFNQLKSQGFVPDAITFISILKAYDTVGATHKGQEIHVEIVKIGFLDTDHLVGNALVNMYARCGSLAEAKAVFDKLPI
eukprot:c32973_g1_i1 orf=33-1175(+)